MVSPYKNQHPESIQIDNTTWTEQRTLNLNYNKEMDLASIAGHSITEDIHSQYLTFMERITNHFNLKDVLTCHVKYYLLNCSTVKYIFDLIKGLNKKSKEGKEIKFIWHAKSDDMDMIETGLDFQEFCLFDFSIELY